MQSVTLIVEETSYNFKVFKVVKEKICLLNLGLSKKFNSQDLKIINNVDILQDQAFWNDPLLVSIINALLIKAFAAVKRNTPSISLAIF